MKKFLTLVSLGAALSVYASDIDDLKAYDAGKSLEWFFNLRAESVKKSGVEEKILAALRSQEVSDEAFSYACKILKPIATDDSIEVLGKYLDSDIRATSACEVLIGIDDGDVDKLLIKKLSSAKGKAAMEIVFALGARGNDSSIPALLKAADSSDNQLAICAVNALGRINDISAVKGLVDIASKSDFRKDAAYSALASRACAAWKAGKKNMAKTAANAVPSDYAWLVGLRGDMAGAKRVEYLDSIIIEGGKNAKFAARAMNEGRTFENSSLIISKFDSMSDASKIMAIASFMIAADVRFFPVIEKCMDSKDSNLRAQAIYSARFLCADEGALRKIYSIMKESEAPFNKLAKTVLLENSSLPTPKILKEMADKGDNSATEILILRGDIAARDKVWKVFFEGKADSATRKILEDTMTYAELKNFAAKAKECKEPSIRMEVAKIIIKSLAKSKDKEFIAMAVPQVLGDNFSKDSEEYKLIVSKLGLK